MDDSDGPGIRRRLRSTLPSALSTSPSQEKSHQSPNKASSQSSDRLSSDNNSENARKRIEVISPEILFLVEKFLSSRPEGRRAAQVLREDIDNHGLMPPRIDWEGNRHTRTFEEFDASLSHISPDHLIKICSNIPSLVDRISPPSSSGVHTLLGSGQLSVLRFLKSREDQIPRLETKMLSMTTNGRTPVYPFSQIHDPKRSPNVLHHTFSRQNTGRASLSTLSTLSTPCLYHKTIRHHRLLGHLSAVYNVCFDRSGRYIFTGADDSLIKIWSAIDGRLLSTLRGHSSHITDFHVNYENTLLATASSDKTVRIWCLKTTATLAVLSAHSQAVCSVKFCPLKKGNKRYLVSTANDGSICFWTWDVNTREFDPVPNPKFIERTKPGCHINCSSFSPGGVFFAVGSNDHYVRVYHVDGKAGPCKILEIEGHAEEVDSIQFANWSPRFISGSKDGIANIWNYERQTWKNIPLEVHGEKSVKVNMVEWTNDDAFVITSYTDYAVRIWDSCTGKLIHCLSGIHSEDVFVLVAHPTDPRVFMTGGYDGKLILWDVFSGKPLKTFINDFEGQGICAIFDAKFSRDGTIFASTDGMGNLSIYGFGSNDYYRRVPDQVFFHTDYRPVVRDANNFVIDEQTQCPPHLMPPPFLVDIDGNPHPPHFQRLVPGRENCNDDQLVPYVAVQNEAGVPEVLQPVNPNDPNAQPAVIHQPAAHPTIDDRIQEILQEQGLNRNNQGQNGPQFQQPNQGDAPSPNPVQMDHDYGNPPVQLQEAAGPAGDIAVAPAHPATGPSNRYNRVNSQNDRGGAGNNHNQGIEGVRQSSGNWQSRGGSSLTRSVWGVKRMVVKELPESEMKKTRSQLDALAVAEAVFYKKECSRRPAEENQVEVVPLNPKEKFTRRKRRICLQRQGVPQTSNRFPRGPNSLGLLTPAERAARDRAQGGRSGRRTTEYDDIEDMDMDDERDADREERMSGAESWTGSSESSEDSTEESDSAESDSSDYDSDSPRRRRRVTKRPRGRSESEDEEEEEHDNHPSDGDGETDRSTPDQRKKKQLPVKKPPKRPNRSKYEDIYKSFKPSPKFRYPDWLSRTDPQRTPYFPQIGDEVVYFKKGHQAYLEKMRTNWENLNPPERDMTYDAYRVPKSAYDIFKKKFVKDEVFALVTDIKYSILLPHLVSVKLTVLTDGEPSKDSFTVRYHDVDGLDDFIVLKQFYDEAMEKRDLLVPGVRVRVLMDDIWYFGTIERRVDSMTPFMSIEVVWDNGEKEEFSPWDLHLTPDGLTEPEPGSPPPLSHEDRDILSYKPSGDDWPSVGVEADSERIIAGLEKIMEYKIAEDFNVPVNLEEHPVYGMTIPYLIDLNTIKERVRSHFYRRKDALLFDVSFVEKNATLFNEPGSSITVNARMVTAILKEFISDPDCEDPKPIFQRVVKNKAEYEDRDSNEEEEDSDFEEDKRNLRKSRVANRCEGKKSWRKLCKELIDRLLDPRDPEVSFAEPFRTAVDPVQYPDYLKTIDTPMDLTIIREQLVTQNYESVKEFLQDIKLIVDNSRKYNTDKRSLIYKETTMFDEFVREEIHRINRSKGHGGPREGMWRKSAKSKTKKSVKKRKVPARSISSPELSEPGSSGLSSSSRYHDEDSQPGPSKSRPSRGKTLPTSLKENIRVNGSIDYKALVGSDEDDDEDYVQSSRRGGRVRSTRPKRTVALNRKPILSSDEEEEEEEDEDTEIEDNEDGNENEIDGSATEIEDEEEDGQPQKSAGKKRKAVKFQNPKKAKKAKKEEDDDFDVSTELEEGDDDDGDTDYTEEVPERSSSQASIISSDNDGWAFGRWSSRIATRTQSKSSTTGTTSSREGLRPRRHEPTYDDDEFEHDSVFKNAGKLKSSRGRIIKLKGQRTGQTVY